jgi:hypothetical protein
MRPKVCFHKRKKLKLKIKSHSINFTIIWTNKWIKEIPTAY